ncbi:MAG: helix-turn-helix domain-containing protein [Thiothrix sp.]|uniref:helix-turn-helix domain-containing protein n=1 Tax=Thiothrix sp. TaxID=1032 RepID=UPI002625CB8A|nr:helix-turn-helix domain-containing protein [Thiothrix sp.]MDD5394872.1 helix-turn-helix domain-containing protein [Thiothrix sp.]
MDIQVTDAGIWKPDADAVIDRMLLVSGVSSDSAYAAMYGLPRSTVGNWRRRKAIPYAECERLFLRGVSFDWLLAGQGNANRHETETANTQMQIHISAAGKWTLEAPQQAWRGEGGASDKIMQRALFAGQEMIVIKEDDDADRFGLRYLGFSATGFLTMEAAKQAAPEFAQRVLGRMVEMVS